TVGIRVEGNVAAIAAHCPGPDPAPARLPVDRAGAGWTREDRRRGGAEVAHQYEAEVGVAGRSRDVRRVAREDDLRPILRESRGIRAEVADGAGGPFGPVG